jgi:hypothetical protein
MQFELSVEVGAPAAATWAVLARAEDWPRWTASMQEVRWLDGAGLRVGARARVRQPGLPPVIWTVSELEPGRVFTWVARSPGVRTVGFHRVEALGADRSRLTLGVDQAGWLAPLAAALMGARTRRYVTMEGEGLKRAAEAGDIGSA